MSRIFPRRKYKTGYRVYLGMRTLSPVPGAVTWRIRPQDNRLEIALGGIHVILLKKDRLFVLSGRDSHLVVPTNSVAECLDIVKKTMDSGV